MPFKTLSSPRRVTDLGADVRSCSALTQANLLAIPAPVRCPVATKRVEGQPGKIINPSLGTEKKMACSPKEAAALGAAVDAVWPVLDSGLRPKLTRWRAMCERCARGR